MNAWLFVFCVLEGLTLIGRLAVLADGETITKKPRSIAFDALISAAMLIWLAAVWR